MAAIYTNEPAVKQIVKTAFPDYNGRKISITTRDTPIRVASYWSEGTRDDFALVDLATMRTIRLPDSHPYFDRKQDGSPCGALDMTIPAGAALVTRHYHGSHQYVSVAVRSETMNPSFLPARVELTEDERTVLDFTSTYKSSYAGIRNLRYHEAQRATGITLERWETAKAALISRQLLNKAGAITDAGRNAVSTSA